MGGLGEPRQGAGGWAGVGLVSQGRIQVFED